MNDVLGYQGKKVVITGAASGMGAAATKLLVELGAEMYALDISDVSIPVKQAIKTDLKDQTSVDAAIAQLPGEIHALFNCAGVPHPPFSALDTVMINWVGTRYLTDALIPRIDKGGGIASIASTAGMAWKGNLELVKEFLGVTGYAESKAWLQAHPDLRADAYGFAKQCMIVYTMTRAGELARRDVRINCISPSPTATAFMDQLTQDIDPAGVKLFCPSNGRFADPAEMGEPMVLLNSRLASFVSGNNLPVDFGYCAEVWMEQRDNLLGI